MRGQRSQRAGRVARRSRRSAGATDLSVEPVDGDPLVEALGRLSDRLSDRLSGAAAAAAPPDRAVTPEPAWGPDAAASPVEYRHWLHRTRDAEGGGPALPPAPLGPLLSVVVPVYRPMLWYLRACVASVVGQTYPNWELCLCDDGSGDPELTSELAELAGSDPRITAVALPANGGISRATNRALQEATGEFVLLLDHDDELVPEALAEVARVAVEVGDADVIYSDEDKLDESGLPCMPHFKPDWDPDLLMAYPYLGHLVALRHDLVRSLGGLRPEFDGSQDYDLMMRATERARRVVHIPQVLYHWRMVAGSAAGDSEAKPWAHRASRRALEDAVERRGIDAEVVTGPFPGGYHVRRRILGTPTVSVIVPFRDQAALTAACLASLAGGAGHPIAESVLVDNGSAEPETLALRRQLQGRADVRIIDHPGAFNWAAINNAAAATCRSDLLLFLNNDIEASGQGWLAALVEQAQREEIGAVGARLVLPDGRLQHAGVVLGLQGVAGHLFAGKPAGTQGYFWWDRVVRGFSAVTAACMLVRRSVFEEVGGFDEALAVGFNDVDFCLRLRRAGYRTLYTPHAELTHHESLTRGFTGHDRDRDGFVRRWGELVGRGDPAYNPNLGRLEPWCPLRFPDEDHEWRTLVRELAPVPAGGGDR